MKYIGLALVVCALLCSCAPNNQQVVRTQYGPPSMRIMMCLDQPYNDASKVCEFMPELMKLDNTKKLVSAKCEVVNDPPFARPYDVYRTCIVITAQYK